MKLLSCNWVMKKAKYLVGKQGIACNLGINLFTIQILKNIYYFGF